MSVRHLLHPVKVGLEAFVLGVRHICCMLISKRLWERQTISVPRSTISIVYSRVSVWKTVVYSMGAFRVYQPVSSLRVFTLLQGTYLFGQQEDTWLDRLILALHASAQVHACWRLFRVVDAEVYGGTQSW